jgi:hypothetical protein
MPRWSATPEKRRECWDQRNTAGTPGLDWPLQFQASDDPIDV